VIVRWRLRGDGSWSAGVLTHEDIVAEATAATGRELLTGVAAALDDLADQPRCPRQAVHDLEGDPRAFAAVALMEGFHDHACHQFVPRRSLPPRAPGEPRSRAPPTAPATRREALGS
jgi:hypothetical protein